MRKLCALIPAMVLMVSCAPGPPLQVTPCISPISAGANAQALRVHEGDASRGRRAFIELHCHACHDVAGDETLPHELQAGDGPVLRDLAEESPEAVAAKIVSRTDLDPESLYEDSPMVPFASAMTEQQLVDVVAYLRNPAAGGRSQGTAARLSFRRRKR